MEVVKLPEAKHGFGLLPRRWVVERTSSPPSKALCGSWAGRLQEPSFHIWNEASVVLAGRERVRR